MGLGRLLPFTIIYLHLLSYFDTHRCSSPTCSFLRITHQAFEIEWSKGHFSEVVVHLYNVEYSSEAIYSLKIYLFMIVYYLEKQNSCSKIIMV